jgi:hypothetical protein
MNAPMLRPALCGLALTLAAAVAAPASAATALNGELNAVANVILDTRPTHTSSDSQSWNAVPATLNTTVHAHDQAVIKDHNSSADSFGDAQATWVNADSGAVDFTNYGWTLVTPVFNAGAEADVDFGRPGDGLDWSYTFTATHDGQFTMAYDVNATGDKFGLYGWNITFNGLGGGLNLLGGNAGNDPTQSGVFQRSLVNGQTYTVGLSGNPNIGHAGGTSISGAMNGNFDWQITGNSVPEPATWALMISGFGLAGVSLRRRRAAMA